MEGILTVEKEFEEEVQIQTDTKDKDLQADASRSKKSNSIRRSSPKDDLKNKLKTNENDLIRRLNTQNRL